MNDATKFSTCLSQFPSSSYELKTTTAYTLWHLKRNNSAKLLMGLAELHVKDATTLRPQSESGRTLAYGLASAVQGRLKDVLALNPYDIADRSRLNSLCDTDDELWDSFQSESWEPMASMVRQEVDRLRELSVDTGPLSSV